MDELPRFYRNDQEWNAIAQGLKLTPCPHCHTVGALMRHGSLYGFDDTSPRAGAAKSPQTARKKETGGEK